MWNMSFLIEISAQIVALINEGRSRHSVILQDNLVHDTMITFTDNILQWWDYSCTGCDLAIQEQQTTERIEILQE